MAAAAIAIIPPRAAPRAVRRSNRVNAPDPRFVRAVASFQAVHDEDPAGRARRYHEGVAAWVLRLTPGASDALRLASWCQHLRRWALPRTDFAAGRTGYKTWRSVLARHHAKQAGEILRAVGYGDDMVARVGELLVKKRLRSDPEVGALEDAVCLVFLQQQAEAFAAAHPEDKIIEILQKTWGKMTERGRAAAVEVLPELPPGVRALLARAIAST
jgi:hypothetical protein